MKALKEFYRLIKPTHKYIYLLTLFSVIASAISVGWPYIMRNVINEVVSSVNNGSAESISITSFLPYMLLIVALSVVNISTGTAQSFYQVKMTKLMEQIIRTEVFDHLASLSIDFFENEKVGKIVSKISRGVGRGTSLVENLSNWALSQFITYFVVLFIFFRLSWVIGSLCIIVSVVHILVSYRMTNTLRKYHEKINKQYDEALGHQVEVLQNIHLVKHFAMDKIETNKFRNRFDKIFSLVMERAKKRLSYGLTRNFLSEIMLTTVVLITIYEALIGRMTPGDIFLVVTFINYIRWPLWNFSWIYDEAAESLKSIEDIMGIFEKKPLVLDAVDAKALKIRNGSISLAGVSFEYKKGENILKNISLEVPGGKSIAFVGASGVGKSTIIKLISRFYDATAGKILIDGQDITAVTQKSLHRNIGVVLQQNILFNDTISNNLRYGTRGITEAQMKRAAKIANIDKFIEGLPDKYNTMVGERGVKLSGGESQRIAIARAILRNAPILILDEATSSLDSESEKLIQDALWKLIEGRTTIIVAHRLSTVMKADLIVVMDKGKIVEQGTHADLVQHKGIYSKLFEIQSGGYLK